jgi:peptide/nickel transport system substrate-binding protein
VSLRAALTLAAVLMFAARAGAEPPAPAIAMHGAPALPAGFPAFPYANPDAPRGGALRLAYHGSIDSLNTYKVKSQ